MERLLAARVRWIRAYLDGDVRSLDELEADEFSSTCRLGSQVKKDQLEGIASAVREGIWYIDGSSAHDIERSVQMIGNIALLHGFIRTSGFGRLPPSVVFTEVWQDMGMHWRALRIHFSDARR